MLGGFSFLFTPAMTICSLYSMSVMVRSIEISASIQQQLHNHLK